MTGKVNVARNTKTLVELEDELGGIYNFSWVTIYLDEYRTTMKTKATVPKGKYGFPKTASQEIGWNAGDVISNIYIYSINLSQ